MPSTPEHRSSPSARDHSRRKQTDWSKEPDLHAKKKVQNRIAQRTYRGRMKARMEELQAKVRAQEHRGGAEGNGATTSPRSHPKDNDTIQVAPSQANPHDRTYSSIYDGRSNVRPPVHDAAVKPAPISGRMYQWKLDQRLRQDSNEPAIFNSDQAGTEGGHHGTADAMDQLTGNGYRSSGQESMPPVTMTHLTHQQIGGPHGINKLVQDPQIDMFRTLQDSHSSQRIDAIDRDPFSQHLNGHVSDDVMSFGLFNGAQDLSMLDALSFPNFESIGLTSQSFKQDAQKFAQSSRSPTSNFIASGSINLQDQQLPGRQCRPNGQTSPDISAPVPGGDAPLEKRIGYVLAAIKAAGFEDFTECVKVYYTATLSDTSPLHIQQRISRNRRLPPLISKIRESAEEWSEWERQGCSNEMLRGAEELLKEEYRNFGKSHTLKRLAVQAELYQVDEKALEVGMQYIESTKRAFQEELPNLSALITALSSETDTDSAQGSIMQTVFITIFMLFYGSRTPPGRILALVQQCLKDEANSLH